ncbi:Ig-like domain-containing protein, partial [Flavobacterium collinsii]
SWSSNNTTVATVDALTGEITGAAAGTATISYTVTGTGGCGNASATRTVTVTAAPNAGTLSGTQEICLAATTTFTSNGASGGSWSSNNTIVATVDASGVITGKAFGTATISYTVTGTGGCADAIATRTVTVSDTQKPTITCPANVTAVADTNSCAATGVVLGTPTTSDNCSGTVTVTNDAPLSFPIGITTVTWTAKDVAGNIET